MKTKKFLLALLLSASLAIAGCSGGGGGGGGSSGGSSGGSGGGGGGGGSASATTNFSISGFTKNDQGVLITSSHQSSVSSPYFSLSSLFSGRTEKNMEVSLNKEKNSNKETIEKKDLPEEFIEYARKVQETEGIKGVDPAKLKKGPDFVNEGDQIVFNILENGESWAQCTAQCYKKGTNCYVFIDTSSTSGNGGINAGDRTALASDIARNFDSNNTPFNTGNGIYGVTRTYFGSEWTPGIDSDARIYILISPELGRTGLYGYYYSLDETTGANSNQKEIIYINDNLWGGNMYNGLATISHEFQHMINWNEKYRGGGSYETTSINEGQSMLSEQLNGFIVSEGAGYSGNGYMIRAVRSFLNSPQSFWFFSWGGSSLDYGAAYLFFEYIYERFGAAGITNIATSSSTGSSNITTQTGVAFDSLFNDWALVNYYDTLGGSPALPSGSGTVRYANINLGGTYTGYSSYDNSTTASYTLPGIQFSNSISSYPSSGTVSLNPWNLKYIKYTTGSNLGTLSLSLTYDSTYEINSSLIFEQPAGTYSSRQ